MKTSLKKLQKFAALRHDRRAPKHHQSPALDELSRATQDMEDMRDCYDRLLSAAAATANSVYEFSESLREMGDCLLEKTALNDDEESGKVLLMMGKAQFELQKLVDDYRSHIFRTITIPSESLLNELRIVEEMKQRCDGKRDFYEDLLKKQKDKGRLRNSKGENFSSPPLEEAHDEYDEEANVFVFRMKSLKQGQSRSFLTQASRHHAAQMYFFKKAVKSLEAIEPHVRLLAEQQHIDYQFSGLEDDGHGIYDDDDDGDDDDDDDDDDDGSDGTDDSSDTHDDEELSFDNGQNGVDCVVQEVSTLKNSMELDTTDMMTFSPDPKAAKEILPSLGRNFSFQRGFRATSVSAPLFPENKLDSGERMSQLGHSSSRKFTSYVLPTPDETRSPVSGKIYNEAPPQTRQTDLNIRHSSPLGPKKYEKLGVNGMFSGPIIIGSQSVLKERNSTPKPSPLPSPLSETLPSKQLDPNVASYAKKAKRQAFSGPLTRKSWPNNPNVTASGPIASSAFPLPYSGSLLRTPLPQPTSNPKLPSLASHNFVSSPKISELHELPRPPNHIVSVRPFNRSAHSGPLISQTNKVSSASVYVPSAVASALPMPPPPVELSRSYSNPARSAMDMKLRVPLEATQNLKKAEDIFSPPLTPISLLNVLPPCQPFK